MPGPPGKLVLPEQMGSLGLLVQVAMMLAQPLSAGFAVHCAKLNPVPVHAPGLAAHSAAQPGRVGLVEHWAMVTTVLPPALPVQMGEPGLAVQVAISCAHPVWVGFAVH